MKWFNGEKGYGFITRADGDKDLFVHFSGIQGEDYEPLPEGAQVEYEPQQGEKGPQAVNVSLISLSRIGGAAAMLRRQSNRKGS